MANEGKPDGPVRASFLQPENDPNTTDTLARTQPGGPVVGRIVSTKNASAMPAPKPGLIRRTRGWIAKHVFSRRKNEDDERPGFRPEFWIPIGAALFVGATVLIRVVLHRHQAPEAAPIVKAAKQGPPPIRIAPEVKNETLGEVGYSNPDIGLEVPKVEGWNMKLADREDMPKAQYQGALVVMTRDAAAAPEKKDAPVVSVVRRKASSRVEKPEAYLKSQIGAVSGREILEQPAALSINGHNAARAVYVQGPVVSVQYAFTRPEDVIVMTALVERAGYNDAFKAEVDSIARGLRLSEDR